MACTFTCGPSGNAVRACHEITPSTFLRNTRKTGRIRAAARSRFVPLWRRRTAPVALPCGRGSEKMLAARTNAIPRRAQASGTESWYGYSVTDKRYSRAQYRKPIIVFASIILFEAIRSLSSFFVNQRASMRSSSIGCDSPSVRSLARKIVIFSST